MMMLRRLSGDEIAVIRKSVWMAGDWGRRQSISGGSSSIQSPETTTVRAWDMGHLGHWCVVTFACRYAERHACTLYACSPADALDATLDLIPWTTCQTHGEGVEHTLERS